MPKFINNNLIFLTILFNIFVANSYANETHKNLDNENKKNNQNFSTIKETVTISPEIIQKIGIKTERPSNAFFGSNIRSYGTIVENPRIKNVISSRVSGWIETIKITAIGDKVKKGDLLFTLYSPELISAQQDYITALRSGIKARIYSSKTRLQSLGVSEKTIDVLRKKRKKLQKLPFYSNSNGIISEIFISKGSYIKPGMKLASVQSYQNVWVNVDVAEKDIDFLKINDTAKITLSNNTNKNINAKIEYIHPTINKKTRTGKVRIVINNSNYALKPGSFVDVNFETNIKKRLSVPSDSILKSSEGDYIIVYNGGGKFTPKKIVSGIYNNGRVEILDGVKNNDEIVVSSQFLIDSESLIQASVKKLQKAKMPLSLLQLSPKQLEFMDSLVEISLYIHEKIINNQNINKEVINSTVKSFKKFENDLVGTKLQYILKNIKNSLININDYITNEERAKILGQIVLELKNWIIDGRPKYYKDNSIALYIDHQANMYWIQTDEKMQNPYGNGHSEKIELPDTLDVSIPDVQPAAGGAHANH